MVAQGQNTSEQLKNPLLEDIRLKTMRREAASAGVRSLGIRYSGSQAMSLNK